MLWILSLFFFFFTESFFLKSSSSLTRFALQRKWYLKCVYSLCVWHAVKKEKWRTIAVNRVGWRAFSHQPPSLLLVFPIHVQTYHKNGLTYPFFCAHRRLHSTVLFRRLLEQPDGKKIQREKTLLSKHKRYQPLWKWSNSEPTQLRQNKKFHVTRWCLFLLFCSESFLKSKLKERVESSPSSHESLKWIFIYIFLSWSVASRATPVNRPPLLSFFSFSFFYPFVSLPRQWCQLRWLIEDQAFVFHGCGLPT